MTKITRPPCCGAVALLTAALLLSGHAAAQESEAVPRLDIETLFELQSDWTFASEDEDSELNDLYTTIEPFLALWVTPRIALMSGLAFEPVEEPDLGRSREFEDQGFFAETLFLTYESERFSVYAGKINPPFGLAWDLAPGIYGVDFAEDYELTERIGGGALLAIAGYGSHRLSANTFFLDTSFLSGSAFAERGRTERSDGGASNTGDLSSFSVTLDGGGMPLMPNLFYHLGLRHQQGGRGDPENETGLAATLYGSFDLGPGTRLEPIVEYVRLWNADAQAPDLDYLTAGAALLRARWELALTLALRSGDGDGAEERSFDDSLFQATLGYAFTDMLALRAGYFHLDEDGSGSHGLGALLSYEVAFTTPLL